MQFKIHVRWLYFSPMYLVTIRSVKSKLWVFPVVIYGYESWTIKKAAAAAAPKLLQSCPTLCDPIDSSLPGSTVPGILQVRTLEWVAISFSHAWKWKVKVKLLSHVWLSDPMDCSLPGSSVHGIFQARVLEWVAIAFSGKEGWVLKNWCFWIVVLEKTLESPLDTKEIKPVNPKGNQPWIFIGRTAAAAETPILWPPDAEPTHWKRPWCWERLRAGEEEDDRGWDG